MTAPYSTEAIARVCHDAVRRLQVDAADPHPVPPWESAGPEDRKSTIASVTVLLGGASAEELHAEWARSKAAAGWRRGEFKDPEAKTHPSLVPYSDLPEPERVKDLVFGAIVTAMSGGEPHACGSLLERAQEALAFERERADKAEATIARVRELAESWAALAPADDWGDSMNSTVASDCGRPVLALLGEPEGGKS